MKIFEEMKASLTAQTPFVENPEPVPDLPFRLRDQVSYRIPDPRSTCRCPAWVAHTGSILHVDPIGEMVLIEPEDEPETPCRWVWWGYCRKVDDGQAA